MPYCFVPSCRSGNPKFTKQLKADGKEIPRFFGAPNQEMLQIWNTKIKRGDKQLTMGDRVCSNHFSDNDVIRFFETRLPDGTIDRIPRDRAKLKDGAIPHIFEGYLSGRRTVTKRKKSTMESETKSVTEGEKEAIIKIETDEIHLEEVKKSDSNKILFQAKEDTYKNPDSSVPDACSPKFEKAPDNHKHLSCSKIGLSNPISFPVEEDTNQNLTEQQAMRKNGAISHIIQGYPLQHRKVPKREKSPVASKMESITRKQNSAIEIETTKIDIEEVTKSDTTKIPSQAKKDINPGKSVLNECSPTSEEADDKRWSCSKVGLLKLPPRWIVCNRPHTRDKILAHINDDIEIDKSIKFQDEADVEIKVKGVNYKSELPFKIETVEDAQILLKRINWLRVCRGTEKNTASSSTDCVGATKSHHQIRCDACTSEKNKMRKRAARLEKIQARALEKKLKISSRLKQLEKSKSRLMLRVKALKMKFREALIRCESVRRKSLKEAISQLPAAQQEAVKACFEAAKNKGPSGRRYTMEWANKCLLMRIKSPKLYDYIRTQNILPLPAHSTLTTYTRNIGEASSLQNLSFDTIKEKTTDTDEVEGNEGNIMLDEMELTPGTTSDGANLSA